MKYLWLSLFLFPLSFGCDQLRISPAKNYQIIYLTDQIPAPHELAEFGELSDFMAVATADTDGRVRSTYFYPSLWLAATMDTAQPPDAVYCPGLVDELKTGNFDRAKLRERRREEILATRPTLPAGGGLDYTGAISPAAWAIKYAGGELLWLGDPEIAAKIQAGLAAGQTHFYVARARSSAPAAQKLAQEAAKARNGNGQAQLINGLESDGIAADVFVADGRSPAEVAEYLATLSWAEDQLLAAQVRYPEEWTIYFRLAELDMEDGHYTHAVDKLRSAADLAIDYDEQHLMVLQLNRLGYAFRYRLKNKPCRFVFYAIEAGLRTGIPEFIHATPYVLRPAGFDDFYELQLLEPARRFTNKPNGYSIELAGEAGERRQLLVSDNSEKLGSYILDLDYNGEGAVYLANGKALIVRNVSYPGVPVTTLHLKLAPNHQPAPKRRSLEPVGPPPPRPRRVR